MAGVLHLNNDINFCILYSNEKSMFLGAGEGATTYSTYKGGGGHNKTTYTSKMCCFLGIYPSNRHNIIKTTLDPFASVSFHFWAPFVKQGLL